MLSGTYVIEGIGKLTLQATPEQAFCQTKNWVAYAMFMVARGIHYVPGLDAWLWLGPDDEELRWVTVLGESRGIRVE